MTHPSTIEADYALSETAWLLSFGVHPLNVAVQVKHKPSALYALARSRGDERVAEAFAPWSNSQGDKAAAKW